MSKRLSVVIPCYNSEKFLEATVDKIKNILADYDFEIILVNDSSKDDTIGVIRKLVDQNDGVVGIDLAHNTGQHNATMAGFHYVTGDYIFTAADDGQSPMEKWPEMIATLDDGYDVATVNFDGRGKRSLFRRIGSGLSKKMVNHLIGKLDEGWIAFEFAAKRFVIDEMIRYQGPYASMNGLVMRVTRNVHIIPSPQHERESGKSGYTPRKLVKLLSDQSTTFSIKPLRFANWIGVLFVLVGIVLGVITLISRIMGGSLLLGWGSTIVLLIGLGIIMQMLGIIGEYVGRIYMVMNNLPQYVVREEIKK